MTSVYGVSIGDKFKVKRGNARTGRTDVCTVVDIYTTTNSDGEVVCRRGIYTDANGVEWVEYRDPLAPEPANPYRHVDGYYVVDSPRKEA